MLVCLRAELLKECAGAGISRGVDGKISARMWLLPRLYAQGVLCQLVGEGGD